MFNKQKRFFKRKINQVQCALWDLQFKLFKVRELREERRKGRDRAIHAIDLIDSKLPTDIPQADKDKLMKERAEHREYKEKLEADMKALDDEVNGLPKSEDYPDGYAGILQQIDAHRELLDMYKQYTKSL